LAPNERALPRRLCGHGVDEKNPGCVESVHLTSVIQTGSDIITSKTEAAPDHERQAAPPTGVAVADPERTSGRAESRSDKANRTTASPPTATPSRGPSALTRNPTHSCPRLGPPCVSMIATLLTLPRSASGVTVSSNVWLMLSFTASANPIPARPR